MRCGYHHSYFLFNILWLVLRKLTLVSAFLLSIFLLSALISGAQLRHHPPSFPYASAVAYSRYQADALSFQENPATLAFLQKAGFGIGGKQPFLLPGFVSGVLGLALPAGNSRFGVQVQHSGSAVQHQTGAGLSFAQVLGSRASLGATFYYHSVGVAGYGATGMLGVGLGGCVQLATGLQGGFRVFRGVPGLRADGGESLAAQYDLALGYDLSPQVFLSGVLAKTEGWPPEVQAACSYRFTEKLHSRLGVHSGTGSFFVGSGFRLGSFLLDVFTSLHPRLGFSPGLQLLFKPVATP